MIRGPSHEAGVDGPHQVDVEQVAAGLDHQAQVAHGGEARQERLLGVVDAAERSVDGIVGDPVQRQRQAGRRLGAADEQVQLHVHQAGEQRDVSQVDLGCAARQLIGVDRT